MILVMFETWWDKHLWTQRLHSRLWKSLLQCWRCREPAPAIGDIELLLLKHFDTHSDIRNFDIALNILTHILSCQNLNMILMSWWIFPSISPWSQYLPTFDGGMCTSIQFGISTEARVLTGSKKLSHHVRVLGVKKGLWTDSRADIKRESSQSWGREAGWKVRVTS